MINLIKYTFYKVMVFIFFGYFINFSLAIQATEDKEEKELIKAVSENKKDVKKRYDWMGVPFFKFRSDFGLGGGAKISLFDYGDGEFYPFKYNLQVQYFATSMGKKDHVIFFVAPNFLNKRVNVDAEIRYQYIDNSKFFGIGNSTKYVKDYYIQGSDSYKSSRYYDYKRLKPRFVVNVLKELNKNFMSLMGIGIQKTTIDQPIVKGALEENLLYESSKFGIKGGYTNFFKLGLVYDSRSSSVSPESGTWSEFAMEFSTKLLASDYTYKRYTFTDRRFFTLQKDLVLAQRIIFEWMAGAPPFYEYSFIGGSDTLMEAMGGDKSLRGYLQNRFIDRTKFISNTELRYLLGVLRYKSERFDIYPIAFFDLGRVYPNPSDVTLKYLKFAYGGGFRIAWNKFFIGRMDAGFSEEGYNVSIGFAQVF